MTSRLLCAEQRPPGRIFRSKFHALNQAQPGMLGNPAGKLRSYGEEQFVHQPARQKLSEKVWTAFIKRELHIELLPQKRENCRSINRQRCGKHLHMQRHGSLRSRLQIFTALLARNDENPLVFCMERGATQIESP